MRLALTEQEDTQTQQEQVLEAKLEEIDALTEGGIIKSLFKVHLNTCQYT
jgi:uncharacterized protein (DUF111 family)